MRYTLYISSILCLIVSSSQVSAQSLQITNLMPSINQNNVSRNADIIIEFDQNISAASLNESTIIVRGNQTGIISGVFSGAGSSTVTFNPENDFRFGEIISYTITKQLMSEGGMTLARGHTYSFTAVSAPPASSPISFAQRNISAARSGGRDIKPLDYDGDGDLDIIASSEGLPEEIIVYENDGNMNFCGFNTGGNFRYPEVYDIDGDGDYDNFGATGAFDTELNWFENEGTLPYTERFISSEDPWTLAGGDLDSDGDIDVVAAVILPNRLLWFANDGSGNFSSAVNISTTFGGGSESFFFVRDINSDGAMDILAFHRDDRNLVWYENNGSQSFIEHLIKNTADRNRITSGDIDNDGDIDIVTVSVENTTTIPISWYENDGSEMFTEHPITASSNGRIYAANIGDIDGDFDMDILAGGYIFENDGSQNFTETLINDGFKSGNNYYSNGISFADMDEDGDMDLVAQTLFTITWQENNQFMEVSSTSPANAETAALTNAAITITFDQPIDAVTANSSNIKIFSQNHGLRAGSLSGGGSNTITFTPSADFTYGDIIEVSINERVKSTTGHNLPVTYGFAFNIKSSSDNEPDFITHPILTHTDNVSGLDAADIDGDGDLDLVTCSFTELYWHRNEGNGNFTTIPIATTGVPVGVFAVDQNEDGHMDIWIDNDSFTEGMLYTNDGNQNFTESTIAGNSHLGQLTDVNNDGDIDIVFLTIIDGWVFWTDNNCGGYGGFGNIPRFASKDVQTGDMDNDGDNDFIAASTIGPAYYNNNSYFAYSKTDIDNNNTISTYLADLDGDGDLDPVFIENFSAVIWYENRLNEAANDFGSRREIGLLNMNPRDVTAADIDGDGDPDIAAVSQNDNKVVWYENRLNEASSDFGPAQLGATSADGPIKIQSADMDGDGDMDLITISEGDDELIWFENTGNTVDINENENEIPFVFSLQQNYPNPFNPATTINYSIAKTTDVVITVYNPLGQIVSVVTNSVKVPGNYSANFDAGNLSSGIYYYKILTRNFTATKKMILLK